MRQYDQAIEHYPKLVELEPSVGVNHFLLAEAYEQKGMYAEAIEGYAKHNVTRGFLSPKEEERYREIFRASGWQGYAQTVSGDWKRNRKRSASHRSYSRQSLAARIIMTERSPGSKRR